MNGYRKTSGFKLVMVVSLGVAAAVLLLADHRAWAGKKPWDKDNPSNPPQKASNPSPQDDRRPSSASRAAGAAPGVRTLAGGQGDAAEPAQPKRQCGRGDQSTGIHSARAERRPQSAGGSGESAARRDAGKSNWCGESSRSGNEDFSPPAVPSAAAWPVKTPMPPANLQPLATG